MKNWFSKILLQFRAGTHSICIYQFACSSIHSSVVFWVEFLKSCFCCFYSHPPPNFSFKLSSPLESHVHKKLKSFTANLKRNSQPRDIDFPLAGSALFLSLHLCNWMLILILYLSLSLFEPLTTVSCSGNILRSKKNKKFFVEAFSVTKARTCIFFVIRNNSDFVHFESVMPVGFSVSKMVNFTES